MKSASSAQFVVQEVQLGSVAYMLHKVASERYASISGLSLSCAMLRRSSVAPNQLLHIAAELTSSSSCHGLPFLKIR